MKIFYTLLTLLFILIPLPVRANAPAFRITDFRVDIVLLECGAADIEERVTFLFTGAANGIFMDIDFAGYGDFILQPVARGGTTLRHVQSAQIGDDGVYTVTLHQGNARIQVFSPAQNGQTKTFVLNYRITDGAWRHKPEAVFQRIVLGHGWEVPIERFTAAITLPGGEREAAFAYENIPPGWGVAVGRRFHPDLLPDAPLRHTVWEHEAFTGLVEPPRRSLWPVVITLGVIAAVIIIPLGVVMVLARPHSVAFKERYYRTLPSENGPALAGYLVNHKNVGICDVVATLLDLTRRRILSDDGGDVFTLRGSTLSLNAHEQYLIDWLFTETNGERRCSLAEINDIGEDEEQAERFHEKFAQWQGKVSEEASSREYFETYWRRTPHAQEEYQKWAAFKRYIKHTTRSKSHEPPPPADKLEAFLPYLISLGLQKSLVKLTPPEESTVAAGFNLPLMLLMLNNWNTALETTYASGASHAEATDASGSAVSSFSGGGGGSGGGAF